VGPRIVDIEQRKDKVLAIVVDHYITTVTPVSSAFIVQEYFPDLSSATIRNILADLEADGFLSHPYTSAGRLPTELGYRYYVDHLMNEIKLLEGEKKRIESEYKKGIVELEGLMIKTSQMISDFTHYTSIVSVDGQPDHIYCRGMSFVVGYPEFHDFDRIRQLLSMLEEKERLLELINRELEHKVEIFIGEELACEVIDNCSLVVSRFRKHNGLSGRIAILGPTRMNYKRAVSTLNYFSELMSETL